MTYQLIETKTLGAFAANVEFVSIPQDGTDLLLLVSDRSDRPAGGVNDAIFLKLNNSSSSARRLYGTGSSVASDTGYGVIDNAATSTANTFSNIQFYIPNYASTTTNKSWSADGVMENNATTGLQTLVAGLYASTSAITSIVLAVESGTGFLTGSTFSLYKITKGSSGGVVVS